MLICMNCKNNSLDVSSQNFWKFRKLQENSSPIVLIKVSTIVLKEGRSERGYNPETPSNFPHHSSVMSIEWHAHLSYDWWRLPSGEAALASPCWQAPSNSSQDWASVGINTRSRLGAQCVGLGHSVLGDNTRTRFMTSVSARGRVQGEGLCQGWQKAGAQAYEDLGWLIGTVYPNIPLSSANLY